VETYAPGVSRPADAVGKSQLQGKEVPKEYLYPTAFLALGPCLL